MIKIILIFLCFTSTFKCFGEYRVYQYYVKSKTENLNNVQATITTSTLNPASYLAYHGGPLMIEINLLRSWQCMGNTSKVAVCELGTGKELNSIPGVQ